MNVFDWLTLIVDDKGVVRPEINVTSVQWRLIPQMHIAELLTGLAREKLVKPTEQQRKENEANCLAGAEHVKKV